MREKVIELIEELLQVEPGTIDEDTLVEDIEEWDSLNHVLIIGELESRFGIVIPLDEAADIISVQELFEAAGV